MAVVDLPCNFSSLTRSALSAGGGCNANCDNSRAVPLQAVSHNSAVLVRITSQPQPRLGSNSRAPNNTSSRSGTGGNSMALRSGFQDSMPSKMKRLFKDVSFREVGLWAHSYAPALCDVQA